MLSPLMERIVIGVAGAATLSGGGTIVANLITNTRQDAQLTSLSQVAPKLDRMDDKLDRLDRQMGEGLRDLEHLKTEQGRVRTALEKRQDDEQKSFGAPDESI